jgi:hypothetical protein
LCITKPCIRLGFLPFLRLYKALGGNWCPEEDSHIRFKIRK